MKHQRPISAYLTTTAALLATLFPTQAQADPDSASQEAPAKQASPEPESSAESVPESVTASPNADVAEMDALRSELEALRADLDAEKKAREEADAAHAAADAGEGEAEGEEKKEERTDDKKEEAENPLVPEGQEEAFGKHPVENDKSYWKPGTGLTMSSEDGRFMLATRLRMQLRYAVEAENTEDEDNEGEYDTEVSHMYQIRRARLQFKAHAWNPHNKMKVEFAFSPRDLSMDDDRVPHRTPLLTWYFEFDHLRDFTVRAGQYKIPYSRQRVVSSGNLQLVDRALAQGEFNHDRDIGFDFRSKDLGGLGGKLRYYAGVYMGEGRDFGDRNGQTDFGLHYLARFEVLPFGKFKDYSEADFERMQKPGLSLGATYSFHDDSQGLRGVLGGTPSDGGVTDYHSATADYMFKYKGFSSTGEFFWRKGRRFAGDAMIEDPNDPTMMIPAPVEAARNGVGWFAQAGYLIPRMPLEVAARYSGIRGIGDEDPGDVTDEVETDTMTSLGQRDSVGGGVSYYFAGHPWKIQADYFKQWNEGVLKDGAHIARVQLQLAF